MKKVLSGVVFILLLVLTTGCGETRIEQEDAQSDAQSLTEEDLWRTDFTEYGDTKVRSINDICVIPEPLVRREITYGENDGSAWFHESVYKYDSENRYAEVRYSSRNPETDELELNWITTYSYDDSLYYEDTIYAQWNNIVLHNIYDSHGNPIFRQMYTSEDDEVETITYTYDYVYDAQRKIEEYSYNGKDLFYHEMSLYNENGDETYRITQYRDDMITTITTEYEYNEQNQVIHATRESNFDISNFKTEIDEYTYTYDENGLLVEEFIYTTSGEVYEDSQETIQYQYDKERRMTRKECHKKTYFHGTDNVIRKSSSVTLYEYDLDPGPIQQSQTVSEFPVTPATSAYRNLLEQETFEWDEHGSLYNTSDFQFALINSGDEADTIYLLLQNKESYAAAGTQHLLVYRDGQIITLWGYDQNSIYIKGFGFTKNKEGNEQIFLVAAGGRQDLTNFYVYQLEEDNLDLLGEYSSLERIFLDGSISESHYYWEGEEVSMQIFINHYNDLLDDELTEINWVDNTEENRAIVFGAY